VQYEVILSTKAAGISCSYNLLMVFIVPRQSMVKKNLSLRLFGLKMLIFVNRM
jgi:hypothetical protein